MEQPTDSPGEPAPDRRVTARATLLGERIDISGPEKTETVSVNPLAYRAGEDGFVVLFRYGVAVFVNLSSSEREALIQSLRWRIIQPVEATEEESVTLAISSAGDDRIPPGGPIALDDFSPARVVLVADALAKSVALANEERQVRTVLDGIEPMAAKLSRRGRATGNRRRMVQLIGEALQVQQRMAGRIEVQEKPELLWDRPDLERLYERLADEYELSERATALTRKIDVIRETAKSLTDLIDASRAVRLELAIVALIMVEIGFTLYETFWRKK